MGQSIQTISAKMSCHENTPHYATNFQKYGEKEIKL